MSATSPEPDRVPRKATTAGPGTEPPEQGIDDDGVTELLDRQDGVVSRPQAVALGHRPHDIRRLLRRREWIKVHPGVYVNHTGPLTWHQRAWAAVLWAWPSALCSESALRAADGPGRRGADTAPIHVAIDRRRSLVADGDHVVVHHLADLDDKVAWNKSPPRIRIEHAVLDRAASASDDFAAVEVLSDAVQSRRTSADRIRAVLDGRQRIRRREFLAGVLDDIRDGACSVLEHGYLERVERAHGLPVAERQLGASASGPIYRDVTYTRHQLVVELDGRMSHDSAHDRDRDLDRDLDAAVDRLTTVRIGWGQVFRRACHTAERVGTLLQQRGWEGTVHPCPDCAA